jgi:D-3-phosphoglycerate dehydrogenase
MTRPIIAVTDSPFPSLDPVKAALAALDPDIRMAKSSAPDDILAVAHDADAIIVCYAQITAVVVAGLSRCKVIGRTGLGVDNIDVPAAAARGITVTYVPDYCLREVSDHTMALLLALARKVPLANKVVQSGRWELPPIVPLRRLEGQVLGLVGFGNIPRAVVPKAKAFGLTVITHDPYVSKDALAAAGVEGVSFDDLLARSDFISVHAPLMPATRGLINAAAFTKMKKGAFVINTARGPLIDEPALIAALDSGHLGGAGLDVVTTEPLAKDSALIGRDNVILTPHTAFYSVEALIELQTKCATDVARVLSGQPPVYPVRRDGYCSRSQITITFTTLLLTFGCGIGGLSMNSRSPSKRMKRICSPPTQASFQAISTLVMTRPSSTR